MSKNGRDNRPYIRPVTRLELSEKNIKFRWIAIVLLLSIAVIAIGYGFHSALTIEPGWQEVTVHTEEVSFSDDFVLMYDFSRGDIHPTAAYKRLEILYRDLSESAYWIFSPEAGPGGNVRSINDNPNSPVTVSPELYRALEEVVRHGNRHVFLAPVTALYKPVFLSEGDGEAMAFDPMFDEELATLAAETAAYCSDPAHISLELLGDHRVQLTVSDGYLAFAREYGIETFLDFGWMTNAFVADFLAEGLEEAGFCQGYLVSYDGFTRNLDAFGEPYSVNFFDRKGNDVLMPATLTYNGPMSIVSLRDYPLSEQDRWHYYSYESGAITTVFLDPADGVSKSAMDSLMAYGSGFSCGELVLRLAGVFTADTLDTGALTEMARENIFTVWGDGLVLYHTQQQPALTLRPDSGGEDYVLSYVK